MTLAADGNVTSILTGFGGDPQRAEGLAAFLGFEPVSNPEGPPGRCALRRVEAISCAARAMEASV